MPVFFAKGDILKLDVEAVVIPHAPNDKMLWCNYDDYDYWDITVDVFVRADMKNMIDKYNLFRGNGYKIGEDFIDEDDKKKYFIPEKYPEITVTKSCGLPVESVFHVCVHSYAEYLSQTDDYAFCAEREEYMLSRCYQMALNCAARSGIKKIAFPLFSTDCPKEIAYKVAHSVPQKWLDENTEHEKSALERLKSLSNQMQIYIVEPGYEDLKRMKALRDEYEKPNPMSVSKFEWWYERDKAAFAGGEDAFKLDFIQKRLERYVKQGKGTYGKLAQKSHCNSSDISKLKNGDTKKMRKKEKAIALAVALELSDYERFVFINCTNNKYPVDKMDFLVEKLIAEGKRDLEELRNALYEKNESYDLYK